MAFYLTPKAGLIYKACQGLRGSLRTLPVVIEAHLHIVAVQLRPGGPLCALFLQLEYGGHNGIWRMGLWYGA